MRSQIVKICVSLALLCLFLLINLYAEYSFTAPYKFNELGWGAGNNTRGEKCIDIFGSPLYIVAEANGGGSTMQCYRSTDNGSTWDTLAGLGWTNSRYLSLSIDEGGRAYITWFYMNMTFPGLCKTAALYGNTFQATGTGNTWIDWYSNLYFAGAPSISAKGTTEGNPLICASQESFDGTSYYEIVLDCPLNPMAWNNFNYWNGPPYHDDYLTYPVVQQIRPCVRLDEGNYAHIIWEDNRAGVQRLTFRRSSNILSSGGPWPLTWNSLVYVDDTGHNTKGNTTGYVQGHSQIVVTGSGASAINYAVWVSSDNNIYFDKSTNGGAAWGTDVRVNDNTAASREWPSLSLDGSDNIYVVWMDNRDGNSNIYFSYSTDGGNTFSPDTCVHNATPEDKYPGITAGAETDALSEVHIAWTRVDTTLYSKGSPVPVGITEIDFTASCCKDGIVLKWTTRGQIHGAAWILYRSESKNHGYFEIDSGPVNPREKRHTYTDKNVIGGTLYLYRLNLLNEDGTIGHT
ncbi:MAG: hypothetical protein E3J78_01435, partial [Candidatus Cloacimonadota bacterium]